MPNQSLFGERIAGLVAEVTDDPTLSSVERSVMQEREARFKSQPATLIRLADKTCNVRDITRDPPASWSVERQVAYFAWAEGVVAGLRGVHTKLESEFDDALLSARLGTLPSSMGG